MQLKLKSFDNLVQDMGAALQGSATALIDVSVGSIARALFEANASVALWVQWLILQVLLTTRAATSTGSDLDTWMADFALTRLPATQSTGLVTFSRYTSTSPATIPIGAVVKTADGSVSFSVVQDPQISIWQPSTSTYVLPAGVSAANLPVSCNQAGSTGNVLAGAIAAIASSLPGVDLVTNSAPFTDGCDAETDDSLRTRFRGYLASLSRATLTAVTNAVAGVQQGLNVHVQENTAANGSASPGWFNIVVDDGSGYPPATLLANVANAVDAVRPIGTMFSVNPPTVVTVTVGCDVWLPATSSSTAALASIQQQVATYLNGLHIGQLASVTRVAQCIYQAVPSIENVSGILLNGLSADISPGQTSVVKAGTITVTINAG